jgi:hypothetical protein
MEIFILIIVLYIVPSMHIISQFYALLKISLVLYIFHFEKS